MPSFLASPLAPQGWEGGLEFEDFDNVIIYRSINPTDNFEATEHEPAPAPPVYRSAAAASQVAPGGGQAGWLSSNPPLLRRQRAFNADDLNLEL